MYFKVLGQRDRKIDSFQATPDALEEYGYVLGELRFATEAGF